MRELLGQLRSYQNRIYAGIFLLMILSGLVLFGLAEAGSSGGLVLVLGLLFLVNLLVVAL